MNLLKKILQHKIICFILVFITFIYLNNSSIFIANKGEKPTLLAHRGLAQTFSMEGMTGETNTAKRIYVPEHPYLENTIASMEAAFEAGADRVEFDIQLTKDKQFAVFHDATLDYRTDGVGSTREYTMQELKTFDIGYGYTADNGKTYPFRGKGIDLMPSLNEVLDYFPDRLFLIHIKSNDPQAGELLAECLRSRPQSSQEQFIVYGGDKPIEVLKQKFPSLRVMSKQSMKKALASYMLVGWTGYMPESMKNTYFHLPQKYARVLWGWPHRFVKRMEKANSLFILVAGEGEWSEGFDSVEDLEQIPPNYTGGIWTNRIDRIGPFLKRNEK